MCMYVYTCMYVCIYIYIYACNIHVYSFGSLPVEESTASCRVTSSTALLRCMMYLFIAIIITTQIQIHNTKHINNKNNNDNNNNS